MKSQDPRPRSPLPFTSPPTLRFHLAGPSCCRPCDRLTLHFIESGNEIHIYAAGESVRLARQFAALVRRFIENPSLLRQIAGDDGADSRTST